MPGCLELSDFRSHALDKFSCGPKGKDDLYDRHFPLMGQCFSWKSDEFLSLCCLPPWSTTSSDWSSSTISKFYLHGAAHLGVLSPLLQVNEILDGNGNITDISLRNLVADVDRISWASFGPRALRVNWATCRFAVGCALMKLNDTTIEVQPEDVMFTIHRYSLLDMTVHSTALHYRCIIITLSPHLSLHYHYIHSHYIVHCRHIPGVDWCIHLRTKKIIHQTAPIETSLAYTIFWIFRGISQSICTHWKSPTFPADADEVPGLWQWHVVSSTASPTTSTLPPWRCPRWSTAQAFAACGWMVVMFMGEDGMDGCLWWMSLLWQKRWCFFQWMSCIWQKLEEEFTIRHPIGSKYRYLGIAFFQLLFTNQSSQLLILFWYQLSVVFGCS